MTKGFLLIEKIDNNYGFAEVRLENVNIIQNYNILLHIIDPTEIEKIVSILETNIMLTKPDENREFLQNELNKVRTKLQTILPHRQKRGLINIAGTAMKWLYGTMDDNDRQEIEHLKVIDENNHAIINSLNKNILINDHFNKTFETLKKIIESDRSNKEGTPTRTHRFF